MTIDIFPYVPRPGQSEFIRSISSAVKGRYNIIVESGTGTGKTVCALTGTLSEAITLGKKVIYLTLTNSQQQQVMVELRRMN